MSTEAGFEAEKLFGINATHPCRMLYPNLMRKLKLGLTEMNLKSIKSFTCDYSEYVKWGIFIIQNTYYLSSNKLKWMLGNDIFSLSALIGARNVR
jgi:hypothetical protein